MLKSLLSNPEYIEWFIAEKLGKMPEVYSTFKNFMESSKYNPNVKLTAVASGIGLLTFADQYSVPLKSAQSPSGDQTSDPRIFRFIKDIMDNEDYTTDELDAILTLSTQILASKQ